MRERNGTGRRARPAASWLAGLVSAPALALALAALSVSFWPAWPGLRTGARILENLVPGMVLAALAGAGLMALLRAPRAAVALCVAMALGAAGLTTARQLARSLPVDPDLPVDLTVLWFNLLSDNATPPADLAAALIASPADVVMVAEAAPLAGEMAALAQAFPVHAGCADARACQMLVLARVPGARIGLREIGRTREPRLAVVRLPADPGAGRAPLALVGLHLFKPWFYGITEGEEWHAFETLQRLRGPVVVLGDLNATPWSRRLGMMALDCAMAGPRLPRPTWPAGAGWLGLPIDHVLVRNARLAGLERWGTDLGSNHAGLLARISLSGTGPQRDAPDACIPYPPPARLAEPAVSAPP